MEILWAAVTVLYVEIFAVVWALWRVHRQQGWLAERPVIEPTPAYDDHPIRDELDGLRKDIGSDLDEVALRIKTLTQAIAEGIERVDRSERRIGATIKRAQEKLALAGYEDPGVEAEVEGLRLLDGDGSDLGGLPAVQPDLGGAGDRSSSVPGVTIGQLQKVRGL